MTVRQRFRSSIRRGTGEVFLIMKNHPELDFSREVLQACLNQYNHFYNGTRTIYLLELLNLTNKKDQMIPGILEALTAEGPNSYFLEQLYELAAVFAREGNEEARTAMYERFSRGPVHEMDLEWDGQEPLIGLDGMRALTFIARTKGRVIQENPEKWDNYIGDWALVNLFQAENPSINAFSELRMAAKNDPYVKLFYEHAKKHKMSKQRKEKFNKAIRKQLSQRYDYATIKRAIDSGEPLFRSGPYYENLSENDIKKLADDFLKETNKRKMEKYLVIFSLVKFPYPFPPLLKIVKGKKGRKYSLQYRLVFQAIKALRFFPAQEIRQFALSKLRDNDDPGLYVELLVGNYRKGDGKLLKKLFAKNKNIHTRHSLAHSYVDGIYEANSTKECRESLEAVYDNSNCGMVRVRAVSLLYKNGVLSDRIKEEIPFDSYEGVWEFYREEIKGGGS